MGLAARVDASHLVDRAAFFSYRSGGIAGISPTLPSRLSRRFFRVLAVALALPLAALAP